jgi:heme-degrading monooxygenase HmoA
LDAATHAEYVLIIREVADYLKWKDIVDQAAGIRRTAGEIDYQLLASSSDETQLVHFFRWRSLEAAKLFFESDELVRIRHVARVQSPEFLYLRQIEQTTL